MSKSGEAFAKLTYAQIRSMTLKEVGEWLANLTVSGNAVANELRIMEAIGKLKCGVMPNEQNRTTSQDISQLSVSF
ncbi:hypothetical protein ES704_02072 [subsurface metagenome]|jgi:hypothetical protein